MKKQMTTKVIKKTLILIMSKSNKTYIAEIEAKTMLIKIKAILSPGAICSFFCFVDKIMANIIEPKDTQKFGHVDTQQIIQAMPEYNKAKTEIDALQAQYEADLKSMQDELQKKAEAFDKEQATLPDNIKQRRQTELQDMNL